MVPGSISTLSGVITDDSSKPIQASIALVPTIDSDVRAESLARSQSNADGTFVIRNVPTGSYALQAFGRAGTSTNPANTTFGALLLTVDGNLSNLVVKTRPGVTLRGRILFEGATPVPEPSKLRINPVPIDFATGPVGGSPASSVINDDWTFEVRNMTGTRTITVPFGAEGWRLKSVVRDGRDITDQPISFGESDVTVEVTLTSNLATVTGSVTDGNTPMAECQVIVFSYDSLKWAYPSRHLMSGRTDAKGTFTLSGLPPGDYLAVAFPARQAQNYQDPAVLELARGFATSITVHEGTQTSVVLRPVRR
jgi:hypothetical protein